MAEPTAKERAQAETVVSEIVMALGLECSCEWGDECVYREAIPEAQKVIAHALAAARQAERDACAVEADKATRSDEACSRDGGCRHVPCLVARQIAAAIRARGGG
jgi:hypothetical protein